MSRYKVELQALPAQKFTARLGDNTVTIELQWMTRPQVFRVRISTAQGVTLTAGRYLLPGADLLAGMYPPPEINYGSLTLQGDMASPANLGINNMLVWADE